MTQAPFPSRFVHLDQARARFGDQVDRVGAFLLRSDDLADRVVESFARNLLPGPGMKMVDQALREGIGSVDRAPSALKDFFGEIESVPAWVDREAIDRGGELLMRAGWFGGVVLGISLLWGYASPAGNKPLVLSGRLGQQAPRRIAETSKFVHATCSRGGLSRQGSAFAITTKVRLMHAQVRRMIYASGKWNQDAWGVPINQHDMAGTAILFSYAPITALREVGFQFTAEETELYLQLWRYSSHLMGVDPALNPASERDACRLKDIIRATEDDPDEDSRELARCLFLSGPRYYAKTPEQRKRAERMANMGEGLVRQIMGEEIADKMDLPKTHYRHAFHPIRATVRGLEGNRLFRSLTREKAIEAGRAYWQMTATPDIAFHLPTELLHSNAKASGQPGGQAPKTITSP